jgi:hypothetical protein
LGSISNTSLTYGKTNKNIWFLPKFGQFFKESRKKVLIKKISMFQFIFVFVLRTFKRVGWFTKHYIFFNIKIQIVFLFSFYLHLSPMVNCSHNCKLGFEIEMAVVFVSFLLHYDRKIVIVVLALKS